MRDEPSPFPRMFSVCALWWFCGCQSSAFEDRVFDDNLSAHSYYRLEGSSCDFYQLVEPGNRSYYLYSPGYPDPYGPDQQEYLQECRWFAKTPSFSDRLVLDCHEFDLPEVYRKPFLNDVFIELQLPKLIQVVITLDLVACYLSCSFQKQMLHGLRQRSASVDRTILI